MADQKIYFRFGRFILLSLDSFGLLVILEIDPEILMILETVVFCRHLNDHITILTTAYIDLLGIIFLVEIQVLIVHYYAFKYTLAHILVPLPLTTIVKK